VNVGAGITLVLTNNSFTLTGVPGVLAEQVDAVRLTVFTNNAAGYSVTVMPTAPDLIGPAGATIPADNLMVREGVGAYASLNPATPVTVHNQTAPSNATGDALANDYQMLIPAVPAGAYTGTLDYIATTL
jgi:hypothetical protein